MSYYVYALLDSRKPGSFLYRLQDGSNLEFCHEPVYIGKGTGNRSSRHVPGSLSGYDKSRKAVKIRKIYRDGGSIIRRHIREFSDESAAYAFETELIGAIGRLDFNAGPLTNGSAGGTGVVMRSHDSLVKMGAKNKAWWNSLSLVERGAHRARMSAGVRSRLAELSESDRARENEISAGRLEAWWATLSDDEKMSARERRNSANKEWRDSMTEEEKYLYSGKIRASMKSWWDSMSEADRRAQVDRQRTGYSSWWNSLTQEAKENFHKNTSEKVRNQDPIRKEASRKRRQESAKEWYESLDDEAKQEMKRKQDAAKANKRLVCCSWCGLVGAQSRNMAQYHFDNCEHYGALVSNLNPWKSVGRYKNSAAIDVPEDFIGKHKLEVPEKWHFLWERVDKASPEMLMLWT